MSNGNGQILFRYYGNVLTMSQATATSDGWLSQYDWNRFNNAAIGLAPVQSVFGRTGVITAQFSDYANYYDSKLTFANSLVRGSGDVITLVGDKPTVPPGEYYGTDVAGSGQLGFHTLPAARVASVFTRTGDITAQGSDYAAYYQPLGSYEDRLTFVNSLTRDSSNRIMLVGDQSAPSAGMYYGTDVAGSGQLGFHAFPPSEHPLGNPVANGMVLSSTTTGVRSWVNNAGVPANGATGYVLTKNSPTDFDMSWAPAPGGAGGVGTVTSFSAGNLSPLFTTSVSTATSTPALSFALLQAPANSFLGNAASGSGIPSFQQIPFSVIASTPTTLAGYGITDPIVLTTGSYANPPWITSLAWSKLTGVPTATVTSVFTRTGAVVAQATDYASFYVSSSGSYTDPSWIASLGASKITGILDRSHGGLGGDASLVTQNRWYGNSQNVAAAPVFSAIGAANLSDGTTGTGNIVLSASPTFTGTAVFNLINPNFIIGTNTNDSAGAGQVGQTITSAITSASAVACSSNVARNLTQISLTAGDWDVRGQVTFIAAIISNGVAIGIAGITTTSATVADDGKQAWASAANPQAATQTYQCTAALVPRRISLTATTTLYAALQIAFNGTVNAFGFIEARRVR